MDWLKYLMIFGAIQGAVLSIALFSIKSPRIGVINRLFAFLVLSVSGFLFSASQAENLEHFPKLFLLSYLFIFCFTPLFHLFLQALKNEGLKLGRRHLIHILPVSIYLVLLSRYLLMPNETIALKLYSNNLTDLAIADFFALTFNLYFIYDGWKIIRAMERSVVLGVHKKALHLFSNIVLLINFLWVLTTLPNIGISLNPLFIDPTIVWTSTSFLIFFFTYFVVIKSKLFVKEGNTNSVPKSNRLTKGQMKEIAERIEEIMSSEKPYLNPDFSLSDLAQISGFDRFKLSIAINQGMETTFFTLINQHRVEEFIQMVDSNEYKNFSLTGIAHESGFKSKSTFYKAFREFKGQSPGEFFKQKVA